MARIVSQTINLQAFSDASAKYITEINSAGIKIHPETYSNNYIQLDGTGLSIYKGSTTYPLATFGGSIIFYEPFSSTQAATIDGNGINIKTGTIASGVTIGASGPTLSTIEANAKQSQIYNIGYNGVLGTHFLGTLTIPNQTAEAEIEIHTGAGQNNNVGQNLTIRVNIKRGYQGATDVTDATCAGITVRYEGSPAIITTAVETNFKIRVTCTNRTEGIFNVYMETDQTYADGWYQVKGRDFTWVHDGTTPATITGTEQTKIASMNPYTTATNYIAYINATDGIKVTYSNASANTTTNYTQISANGISITADSTHYAYVGSGGMSIYSGGIRASFGTDIFLYDGNSHQRAYINSSDGLVLGRWDYVNSRYTQITDGGLYVKRVVSTTDHTQDISMAEFSSSLARIGEASTGHAVIKSDGLHVWIGAESVSDNEVAFFGDTVRIGKTNKNHIVINDSRLNFYDNANNVFGGISKGGYDKHIILGTFKDEYTYSSLGLRGQDGQTIITSQQGTSTSNNWSSLTLTPTAWSLSLNSYTSSNGTNSNSVLQISSNKLALYGNGDTDADIKFSVIPTTGQITTEGTLKINSTSTAALSCNGRIRANYTDSSNYGVWIGRGYSSDNNAYTTNRGLYDANTGEWIVYVGGSSSTKVKTGFASFDTSDRKKKDVIGSINYAKDFILGLKPTQFYWKKGDHKNISLGFIAQEVYDLSKTLNLNLDLVAADYKDETKGSYNGEAVDDKELNWFLSYNELIAPLVQVVQDQQKEIEQLKRDIEQFKNK